VASHRACITKAEVHVVVAVDAPEMGARGALDIQRERPCPFRHPGHRQAGKERALGALVELGRAWVGIDEGDRLVGHEASETVAIKDIGRVHALRMPCRKAHRAVIPRSGSVDVADEAADVAGRSAGLGIEVEQARAAVGPAEQAAVGVCGEGPAAHAPNGRGASGDGRLGATGHHGGLFVSFLARLDRGMSDRLRRCGGARVLARDACLDVSARRTGSVVWALERVVASDGYPESIGHLFDIVKRPMVRVTRPAGCAGPWLHLGWS